MLRTNKDSDYRIRLIVLTFSGRNMKSSVDRTWVALARRSSNILLMSRPPNPLTLRLNSLISKLPWAIGTKRETASRTILERNYSRDIKTSMLLNATFCNWSPQVELKSTIEWSFRVINRQPPTKSQGKRILLWTWSFLIFQNWNSHRSRKNVAWMATALMKTKMLYGNETVHSFYLSAHIHILQVKLYN